MRARDCILAVVPLLLVFVKKRSSFSGSTIDCAGLALLKRYG
jgi:hypothetical protein